MKPASQLNEPPAQISPYAEKRNSNLYKRNAPNAVTYAQLFPPYTIVLPNYSSIHRPSLTCLR